MDFNFTHHRIANLETLSTRSNQPINRLNGYVVGQKIVCPTKERFYMVINGALRAVRITDCIYNNGDREEGFDWDNSRDNTNVRYYFPRYLEVEIAGVEGRYVFDYTDMRYVGYIKKTDYNPSEKNDEEYMQSFLQFLFPKKLDTTVFELLSPYCTIASGSSNNSSLVRYSWDKQKCRPESHYANFVIFYNPQTETFNIKCADGLYPYRTKEEAIADNNIPCVDFDDEESEEETTEFTINVSLKITASKKAEAEKKVADILKKAKIKID